MNGHEEVSVVKTVAGKEAVRWREKEMDHRVEQSHMKSDQSKSLI